MSLATISLPVMSMQCCSQYPYCIHHSPRPTPVQSKSSASLGVAFGTSWDSSMSAPYEPQYSYAPPPPTFHYPSQELESLSMKIPRRLPSSGTPPVLDSKSMWPSHGGDAAEYHAPHWLAERPVSQSMETSQMFVNGYEYAASEHHYPGYGMRDISPSKRTDFSRLSASSEASPVLSTAPSQYDFLVKQEDGHSFHPPQPFIPQEVEPMVKEEQPRLVLPKDTKEVLVLEPNSKSKPRKNRSSPVIHCKICFKSFDRRSNYKSHYETHEKDRERVKCKAPNCEKTFGRTAEMTRHYKSSHDGQSHSCEACKRDLTRHDILLRHQSDACPVIHNGKPPHKRRRARNSSS